MISFVYDKACVFFRLSEDPPAMGPYCAASKCCCLLCSYRQRKIEGLQTRDYVSLVNMRRSYRTTILFSLVAVLMSAFALGWQIVAFALRD